MQRAWCRAPAAPLTMQPSVIKYLSEPKTAPDAAVKDRREAREAQAAFRSWLSACESKVDPMAENHMMRLGAPIGSEDIIFLRQFFWPHIDVEAKVSVDETLPIHSTNEAPWTCIMSDLSQARALYLSHLRVAEDKAAHASLCFVCPTTIKTSLGELMRDPVMASDGHSYERRNIEKWVRETLRMRRAKRPSRR
jgi:hypothetical protein